MMMVLLLMLGLSLHMHGQWAYIHSRICQIVWWASVSEWLWLCDFQLSVNVEKPFISAWIDDHWSILCERHLGIYTLAHLLVSAHIDKYLSFFRDHRGWRGKSKNTHTRVATLLNDVLTLVYLLFSRASSSTVWLCVCVCVCFLFLLSFAISRHLRIITDPIHFYNGFYCVIYETWHAIW